MFKFNDFVSTNRKCVVDAVGVNNNRFRVIGIVGNGIGEMCFEAIHSPPNGKEGIMYLFRVSEMFVCE